MTVTSMEISSRKVSRQGCILQWPNKTWVNCDHLGAASPRVEQNVDVNDLLPTDGNTAAAFATYICGDCPAVSRQLAGSNDLQGR
jgi:hypothetical protein